MRVLFVGDSPNVSTGFSRCTRAVCDELHKQGHEVHILGLNDWGDPSDYHSPIYPCRQPFDGGYDAFGVTRLPILIDRLKPDVIIILNDPWNIQGYIDSIKESGIKGSDCPPIVGWIAVDSKNQDGVPLNSLAHVVVWTEFAKEELVKGGCTTPITVSSLGVDTSIFYPRDRSESRAKTCPDTLPSDAYIVGVVGRNQPRKRLDLTLQYFAEWVQSHEIDNAYLYLHVAPTGDRGADLRSLTRYYGLSGRVILAEPHIGHGSDTSLLPYVYSSFDCYLTTSQGEGFCLPALEAMACGVSCVVPDSAALGSEGGWTRDAAIQIPCETTALNAPLNSLAYTIGGIPDKRRTIAALSTLYQYEFQRQVYGERGLSLAQDLSWDRTAREFVETLEEVLAPKEEAAILSLSSTISPTPISTRGFDYSLPLVFQLKYARYEVHHEERLVRTVFSDSLYCDGSRDESDPNNIREAESQGYSGPNFVWQSLVEHELLHNLVAELFFNRPSAVMRTESGGEFTPLWERYEEETICLALQRYLNTSEMPEVLTRYGTKVAEILDVWMKRFSSALAPLWSLDDKSQVA